MARAGCWQALADILVGVGSGSTSNVAVLRPKKAWADLATRLSRLGPVLQARSPMPGTARQLSRISSAVP